MKEFYDKYQSLEMRLSWKCYDHDEVLKGMTQ